MFSKRFRFVTVVSLFSAILSGGAAIAGPAGVPADIITNIIDNPTLGYTLRAGSYVCKMEIKDLAGNLLARQTLGFEDGIGYAANPPGNGAPLYIVEDEKSGIVLGYEASIYRESFWSKKQIHGSFYVYRRIGTEQDPDGRGFLNKVDEGSPASQSADGSRTYYGEIVAANDTLLGTVSLVGAGSKTQQMDKYSVTASCNAVSGN